MSDKSTLYLALVCCLLLKVLGDGTSGLVAGSRDSSIVKSTLRASLLKVAMRTAVARMWLGDG